MLKPILDEKLHWSSTQFGAINSAFQASYGISLFFVGWFIDRFGTKIDYAVSIAAWSAAAIEHALVGSISGFCGARIALGLGEGGNFPAAIKAIWLPDFFKRTRHLDLKKQLRLSDEYLCDYHSAEHLTERCIKML